MYVVPQLNNVAVTTKGLNIETDYIYIMTYASQRCEYYMQLEDDVVAAASYARVLFNYIAVKSGTEWFVISFSTMGFIGKLFSGASLKYMTYAIALYYRYKPVDWILEDVLRSRYCSLDKSLQDCTQVVRSTLQMNNEKEVF
ncbi:hypothetical protein ANCCAN_13111 [Ancylostoma caninum]|uniref:MGAT4 conserved region domain-containing protein n=1 Tax=Ancylostoma caninum TaxID=29170 RepID=A0A368G9C1_ANCCA|nr:hypothetical protein ANCCAN_13111 [Ancylostoma caninum]